ncbi:hypothetical protein TWF718_005024 [Orbilia javanica]|uniref:Uncharacterized protein n=1 Tax=Orbilia javanica TaxID=47235 RepID=A0AAN8RLF3_9PEZI
MPPPIGNRVTVGVVIPTVSSKLLKVHDVKEVKDVLNRISGMTGLDYPLMTAYCGGKRYHEWYFLAEGDVVCIDYPHEQLPDNLKALAAGGAAVGAEKPFVPRPKAALPIKAPMDDAGVRTGETKVTSIHQGGSGSSGSFNQLPSPVRPLPFDEALALDVLTRDPFAKGTVPSFSKGIEHWENKYPNYKNFGELAALQLEHLGTTGSLYYPKAPTSTAPTSNNQSRWSIAVMDSNPIMKDTSIMFTKNYQKVKVNPMIRVNFRFWTGQEVPLQLHPENRISNIVKSLISMLKEGKEGVTPEILVFKGPKPNQTIRLQDKMSSVFPEQPAEVNIDVSLVGDDSGTSENEMSIGEADSFWATVLAKEPAITSKTE